VLSQCEALAGPRIGQADGFSGEINGGRGATAATGEVWQCHMGSVVRGGHAGRCGDHRLTWTLCGSGSKELGGWATPARGAEGDVPDRLVGGWMCRNSAV
jgi:hypothetical protein